MKSDARLESAVFQLTPTRTRCDLVIKANGRSEKIASGLVNPFLAHLKTAQDQIEKGGYSITLEPDHGADNSWFTKGTVERFVRFVSTPEVLERVNTTELEILQIEEAIAIQGNDNLHQSTIEDYQGRSVEYVGGSKCTSDADNAKAIVLYKPGMHPPEVNGSIVHEENSKVQLLKVLETRKTVLQKEQGMAFARAAAAGFSMENIAHLILFAECFGAARLLEACLKFMELWKRKHETGQWLEIETAEAMSMQSEISSINASGIMLSADIGKQKEHKEQWQTSNIVDSNGKTIDDDGGDMKSDPSRDRRIPGDSQMPLGSNEYFNGQFPHPLFPPWPVHSSPGAPVFQPYPMPMQGMPFYQNYPAGGPYFPPAYTPMEDPRFSGQQRMRSKRHSMDSKGSNFESETYDVNAGSQDEDENASDQAKGVSRGPVSRRKGGRSGKKQSRMVVIRNLNYIASKKHNDGSNSGSESETDDSISDIAENGERGHKISSKVSISKGNDINATGTLDLKNEEAAQMDKVDSDNWQVFQRFLLRDDERGVNTDEGMFSGERKQPVKRWQNKSGEDPILPPERDLGDALGRQMVEFDTIDGKSTRIYKYATLNDDKFQTNERRTRDNKPDVFVEEMEGGRGGDKRRTSEDFVVYRQDKLMCKGFADPFVENECEHIGIMGKGSSYTATDDSFIVPVRSVVQEQHGDGSRTAINMDSEHPSALREAASKVKNQFSYEPVDLSLMPERGMERESVGYDPALDFEVEAQIENAAVVENYKQNDTNGSKDGLKTVNKEKKSRASLDGLEKRRTDALRKGRLSQSNTLAEAQARASKLRAFKADLQKAKKEKEEEEIRRLEALKRERQRRIAARNSNAVQSPSTLQQKRNRVPPNASPSSHRGSKFSDSESASFSPLQKLHVRARSVGSSDSKKVLSNRFNVHKQAAGNGLSQSVSSLPDTKKDVNSVTSTPRTASVISRRFSEPKGSTAHSSSLRPTSSDIIFKQIAPSPKGSSKSCASSLGSASSNQVTKKHLLDEPQKKNIVMHLHKSKLATLPEPKIGASRSLTDTTENSSAVELSVNPHKSKSATLPVPKIRASRSLTGTTENSSAVVVSVLEGNVSKPVSFGETITRKTKVRAQQLNNEDDNGIVEKIVVMLEHEDVSVPVNHVQEPEHEKKTEKIGSLGNIGLQNDAVSEYAAIRAPPSPIISHEVDNSSNEYQLDQQPRSHEMNMVHSNDDKNIHPGVSEKLYQAPYARVTSLEDPCTRNIEYIKAPLSIGPESASAVAETIMVHMPHQTDASGDQMHETLEKPRGKESLKGFKKLLKFGRKSHGATSGEPSLELDGSSEDDQMAVSGSSNEVHMLKNLISQDDTHAGGTPPKASRHFSILSPFRSKATDKKLVA